MARCKDGSWIAQRCVTRQESEIWYRLNVGLDSKFGFRDHCFSLMGRGSQERPLLAARSCLATAAHPRLLELLLKTRRPFQGPDCLSLQQRVAPTCEGSLLVFAGYQQGSHSLPAAASALSARPPPLIPPRLLALCF